MRNGGMVMVGGRRFIEIMVKDDLWSDTMYSCWYYYGFVNGMYPCYLYL